MIIPDIFGSKNEQQSIIGQVDCIESELSTVFLGLVQSMGMANPSASVTSAKKGISVTKKGNKYTLTLEMFQPPVVVSWSEPLALSKIVEFLNNISRKNQKIGWVNILNLSDGSKFLQFAVS